MKKFYLFVFILALFVLQYSVLGAFMQSARLPNLFVALAVSMAIIFGFEKSASWVILAGVLMDVGAPWPIGAGTLVLVLILWLADKIKAVMELRLTRYFFVLLYALMVIIFSFAFDVFLKLELGIWKYIFHKTSNLSGLKVDLNYALKLFWALLFGIGVYYFSRSTKVRFLPLSRNKKL
jgi:hypothetical protein